MAEESAAAARLRTVGRFARRRARRDHQTARHHTETMRDRLRDEWGTLPAGPGALTERAADAAAQQAEHDSRVTDTDKAVTEAKTARQGGAARQPAPALLTHGRVRLC